MENKRNVNGISSKAIILLVVMVVAVFMGLFACNKKDNSKNNNSGLTTKETSGVADETTEVTNETTNETTKVASETAEETIEVTNETAKEDVKEDTTTSSEKDDKKNSYIDGVKKVCIDPGHQLKGNNEQEPIGPGATETKKKVSYGTQGVSTKIPEYELNLQVSLMLRDELILRGYQVVMTREVNEVDISNVERAIFGNESGADIAVRIHANGSEDSSVHGALTIYPSSSNKYVSYLSPASKILSESIINSLCEATGAKNRGALARDNYSGSNWSKIPVTIVEMGYMSNKEEDELMATEAYRKKIVKGIADGIDKYFNSIDEY